MKPPWTIGRLILDTTVRDMKPPWTIGRLILDSQGHEATLDYRKVDTGQSGT